jgi:uncharacterized protein YjiS (DUF1127 family)
MKRASCPSSTVDAIQRERPLFARLWTWVAMRRNMKELLALDDRRLDDIGLNRRALARHYRRRNFWW